MKARTGKESLDGMIGRIDRRDMVAMASLGMVAAGVPLWLSAASGAIGIPSNDDWVYMRAAGALLRTGTFDATGHYAAFVGQLVMIQPLLWLSGGSPWAFEAFGLLMTLLGVASTYLLARRFVGMHSAVIAVLVLVAFPGFARQATTFMTDGPTYALIALCLLLGVRWLQGDGRRATLVTSVVVGLLGFSIREFAIAAPVAIVVVAWARNRVDERLWLAGMSGLLAAGVVIVLMIAESIPGHASPITRSPLHVVVLGPAFATVAAVLLPAISLAIGRRLATISPVQVIAGAALVSLAFVLPYGPFLGNYWMATGMVGDLPLLSGNREAVIGDGVWRLSEQLALLAAMLLAALAVRWAQRTLTGIRTLAAARQRGLWIARSPEAPILLFVIGYAAELAVYASVGSLFDRYLYPIVPLVAVLLLRGTAQAVRYGRSYAFAHGALGWLAVSAFVIAANSFAYDASRWRAGEAAVALGYDARRVDAGLEWVQSNSTRYEDPGSRTYGVTAYDDWFMSSRPCAVVSNSPLKIGAYSLIRVDGSAYRQYLFFGPSEPLYLYGALADGCPPPPAASAKLP